MLENDSDRYANIEIVIYISGVYSGECNFLNYDLNK